MTETWRNVPGFEGYYQVSDLGRVMRIAPEHNTFSGKILRAELIKDGYHRVTLYKAGGKYRFLVHRLVGFAFLGLTPDLWINHKNLVKSDNRLENLELSNPSHNAKHAFAMGVKMGTGRGEHHPGSRLTTGKVIEIRKFYDRGLATVTDLARNYCVSPSLISRVVHGKKWTHVTGAGSDE